MSMTLAFAACISPVVVDGDTIRCKGQIESVRLAGIDAPDKTCAGRRNPDNCHLTTPKGTTSAQSTQRLRSLLKRGRVTVRYYTGLTYGRKIGVLCVKGINVSAYMVRKGYVIHKPTWNGAAVNVVCPK